MDQLFEKVAGELAGHLKKEEMILFPFIKKMVKAKREGTSLNIPHFDTVENPINMMEMEHEDAGEIFREIARLTNNYNPPSHACNTYRALFDKLEEFEEDLLNIIKRKSSLVQKQLPKSVE